MSQSAKSNKVTIVYCGIKGGYMHIPLSILYLGESLLRNGYAPRLVDLRVQDLTASDLESALYLGISHMSGSMQIPHALKCAKLAKSMNIPTVFGGTHPSILPEDTLSHPLVDVVVVGDGEEVVVELAEYFQEKRDLNSVKGVYYKDESGSPVFTGKRNPPPFNKVDHLPYEFLPMHKYLATQIDFGYQSSRGCPHRCLFCAEVALYPRKWHAKPAEVVFEEVKEIVRRFNPKRIFFVDSNFFCDKKRVEKFCHLVIENGLKTNFFGECRFDYFYKYPPEFIELIKRAGFNEIEFGGESGSDLTLSLVRKDITTEQIIGSIEKCKAAGIRSFTSFMIGFPFENDEELEKTLAIFDRIISIDPEGATINGMFVYSPFPGTELFRIVVESYGFKPPKGLEKWAEFELYDSSNITWFDEKRKQKLQTISTLVRFFFVYRAISRWSLQEKIQRHGGVFKALLSFILNSGLNCVAKLRWRYRFFRFDYELRIWQKLFYAYMGRK